MLGEFGDDPYRYASAKARRNSAAPPRLWREEVVQAWYVRNGRFIDALNFAGFNRGTEAQMRA